MLFSISLNGSNETIQTLIQYQAKIQLETIGLQHCKIMWTPCIPYDEFVATAQYITLNGKNIGFSSILQQLVYNLDLSGCTSNMESVQTKNSQNYIINYQIFQKSSQTFTNYRYQSNINTYTDIYIKHIHTNKTQNWLYWRQSLTDMVFICEVMSISDDKIWQTGVPTDEISSNIQRANDRGMFSFTKRMQYKHQLEYEKWFWFLFGS